MIVSVSNRLFVSNSPVVVVGAEADDVLVVTVVILECGVVVDVGLRVVGRSLATKRFSASCKI